MQRETPQKETRAVFCLKGADWACDALYQAQERFGTRAGAHAGVLPNLHKFGEPDGARLPFDTICKRSHPPVRADCRSAGRSRSAGRQFINRLTVASALRLGLACTTAAPVQAETFFDRLMPLLEQIETLNVGSMMINAADNSPYGLVLVPRRLQAGDLVIVGYDATGQADFATVGQGGLTLTSEATSTHVRGLPPGFYPIGSMLFQLGPAAQLSLYDSDFGGQGLDAAQQLMTSLIDGSITNRITGLVSHELTEVASLDLDFTQVVNLGRAETTALGAVNTGEIITSILADFDPERDVPELNFALSQISNGYNGAVTAAETDTTRAIIEVTAAIGGSVDTAFLATNIASNASAITGAVVTTVQARALTARDFVTTVIGAVNGGIVGTPVR